MNLTLAPQTQKQIESHLKSGKYQSAEEVIAAALSLLEQQEQLAEFEPGELDRLLAEGESSGEALDGERVLAELRNLGSNKNAG